MRLTVRLAFQPIWTDQIHDEWIRNILVNRPDLTREKLEKTRELMDHYGRDCQVPEYKSLIASIVLPDPNDRHVVAAAIAAKASVIVTYNLTDFASSTLSKYGIKAQHPDVFLSGLFDNDQSCFMEALHDRLTALKNPPLTIEDQLATMRKLDLAETARRIAKAIEVA